MARVARHWRQLRVWLCILALASLMVSARADTRALRLAEVQTADEPASQVTLPYFVRQAHSGLVHVRWTFELPASASQQRLPALLFPQPVQGLTVKLGTDTLYTLPASSAHTWHHWYRPVLVPVPHALINPQLPTRIHIEQVGHLRGWYIAPVLQGELVHLQPWHDRFLLLSSTLPTTVNFLSMLVGLFVLVIGWRTRASTYIYGGLTTIIWGVLFSLALIPELPVHAWFAWRLLLYACTGNLIYAVLRFLAAIFHQRVSPWVHWPMCWSLQLGWILFALAGTRIEPVLDVGWTAVAVGLYVVGSLSLVGVGVRQREFSKVTLLGLHAALTAILAWHDYLLQAGQIPPAWLQQLSSPWSAQWLQPIYLTHLSLPVFVAISLWLLVQDHLTHRREQASHEQALQSQRERITRDIHDGVGARLNLMLWRTRTAPLVASQLQDELERSIEELRFAINPSQAIDQTLTEALRSLVHRSARWGEPLGIEVHFQAPDERGGISPEQGLHLYKAAHEALSNALRHSGATYVRVALAVHATVVLLTIEDNGHGISGWDELRQRPLDDRSTAMGLRGMRHRLQALGGDCLIRSSPQGTHLVLTLPRAVGRVAS